MAGTGNLMWVTATPTTPSIVSSGLKVYLNAGNSSSYPGSGTTWTDLSGNAANGTLVASPAFTSSGAASYFTIAPTTNDVTIPSSATVLQNLTAFTFSYWVNLPNLTSDQIFYYKSDGDSTSGIVLSLHIGTGSVAYLYLAVVAGGADIVRALPIGSNITANTWVNLSFIWDGTSQLASTTAIYLNGTDASTIMTPATTQNGSGSHADDSFFTNHFGVANLGISYVSIGGTSVLNSNNMKLGKVMIYNRALSSAEISQNFNANRGDYGV